jgi:hypothetical protein
MLSNFSAWFKLQLLKEKTYPGSVSNSKKNTESGIFQQVLYYAYWIPVPTKVSVLFFTIKVFIHA